MGKMFAILTGTILATIATNARETRRTVAPNQVVGLVTRVSDGDTIWVTDADGKYKIRLAKIDAPESDQPYGKESTGFLKRLIYGKEVEVRWTAKDRYGRILGIVMLKRENETIDVNLAMVKNGCAWHYSFIAHTPAYAEAEQIARKSHLGLWRSDSPISPYLWRKSKRRPSLPSARCRKPVPTNCCADWDNGHLARWRERKFSCPATGGTPVVPVVALVGGGG